MQERHGSLHAKPRLARITGIEIQRSFDFLAKRLMRVPEHNHIGLFPPVRGDEKLMRDVARYRGPKGNLKLPLDEPIPYGLIGRIVKARLKEQQARSPAKRGTKKR